MYSSTILFFSALFFTAAPLAARGWCTPNFEGAALTVVWNNTLSWSANSAVGAPIVASTLPSKFFFQQNGDDPDVTYTIKYASSHLLSYGLSDGNFAGPRITSTLRPNTMAKDSSLTMLTGQAVMSTFLSCLLHIFMTD